MHHLVVFARRPVDGRVRASLSPALPPRLVGVLHDALLADLFAVAAACAADTRTVCWARGGGPGDVPRGFGSRLLPDGALGARLGVALEGLLAAPGDRVVAVGSDCPSLAPGDVAAAFAALEAHDLVLGPVPGGGGWLLGLARPVPELIGDAPANTEDALARLRERAGAAGVRTALLPARPVITTAGDVASLVGALARDEHACGERTRDALAAMGLLG